MAGNWEATGHRRLNELNDPLKHKRMEYRRHSVLLRDRVRYDVMIGDIANSQEDVVVNSTGPGISTGPPLAKAIFKKAGPGLAAAAAKIIPLAEGDVVETESFNMGCKEIFHCNAAHWNSIEQNNEKLKHIVKLCLKKASAKQYKSIALPAIGIGIKGYPPEVVSKSITEAITEYVENYSNSSLTHVKLYIFPADDTQLLRKAFSNLLRIKVKGKKVEDGFKLANDVKLTVYNGNLAQTKADAIVLANGCEMNQSARDSLALLYLAAERIRKECGAEDVVVTESFGLPCSSVLHVNCPPWDNENGEQVLEDIVSKCLNKAKDQKLEKVAFPPIGVGAQNYPPEIAAECFLRASSSFAEKNPDCNKNNIILVAHGPTGSSNVKGFEEALGVKVKDQPKEEIGPIKTDLSEGKLVVDLPPNWEKPVDEYKDVSLSRHSPEFESVSRSFKKTIGKTDDEVTLLEVVRIQNPRVYYLYNALKVYTAKELSKPTNNVETSPLWHATKKDNIEKIKKNNFDRGLSGAVGSNMLGACCYFATTSEYSDKWNKEKGPDGEKYMIMARVITGDYCQGHGGLRQAPCKPGSKDIHYNSVVDDVANPTMYGVFNDSSVWPEYVIKYKLFFQVLATPSTRGVACASTYSQSWTPSYSQSYTPSYSRPSTAGSSQSTTSSDSWCLIQ